MNRFPKAVNNLRKSRKEKTENCGAAQSEKVKK